ncbi:hypothetical protein BJV74DRAFT_989281 [Russula compacta]|nr:hypothetical protein BJV74DRAFT_989281 [Russula compacta]
MQRWQKKGNIEDRRPEFDREQRRWRVEGDRRDWQEGVKAPVKVDCDVGKENARVYEESRERSSRKRQRQRQRLEEENPAIPAHCGGVKEGLSEPGRWCLSGQRKREEPIFLEKSERRGELRDKPVAGLACMYEETVYVGSIWRGDSPLRTRRAHGGGRQFPWSDFTRLSCYRPQHRQYFLLPLHGMLSHWLTWFPFVGRLDRSALINVSQHSGLRPHSTSIHTLDDDSLLEIFYLYRPVLLDEDEVDDIRILQGGEWDRERWWYKIAHVCRRWRYLILGHAGTFTFPAAHRRSCQGISQQDYRR